MIFEDFIFGIVQRSLCNQQEISGIFFVFSGPGDLAVRRSGVLQPWPAYAFLSQRQTVLNRSKHTRKMLRSTQLQAVSVPLRDGRKPYPSQVAHFSMAKRQDLRLVPLHFVFLTFSLFCVLCSEPSL